MNENIAFSSLKAELLNKKVSESVAEHLFLLCNYNPDSILVFSDDARYIQGSLNLYKFLVDSSICSNLQSIGKKYHIDYDYKRLDSIIAIINSIRTTLGHNLDERNGTGEDKEKVEQWFLNMLGKKQPSNEKEYAMALDEIKMYGEESVQILNKFIEEIAKSSQKNEIIKEWEKLILSFYKRANSKNIFEGQLTLAYQSRAGSAQNITKMEIASWVKKMFTYREQSQIDTLQNIVRKSSLSTSVLKSIGEKIAENESVINSRISLIEAYSKKSREKLRIFDYWDYYMFIFPSKIEKRLWSEDTNSLLPQEIVQQIIESDFAGIPL